MGKTEKLTIPELINNSVSKYSQSNSLVFVGDKKYSYKQLGEDIDLLAEYLLELEITKGDKVGILSTNMPNWGVAFFSILSLGAIVVPILPDFHDKEIKSILEHSGTKLLFVSEGLYPKVPYELPGSCKNLILIDKFSFIPKGTPPEHLKLLNESLPPHNRKLKKPEVEEQDIASIIYTSGTTGSSKGVVLTHKNLAWTTQQCYELYAVKNHDRFLSILPLSHTLENTVGFLLPIKYGASVHYLRKPPTAPVLLPALQAVKPTIMLSVPLIIEKIFKAKILPNFQKNILIRGLYKIPLVRKQLHKVAGKKLMETFGGNLHFFGIGGAKMDGNVERFLKEGNFPYAIGYGLTETSPLLAGAVVNNTRIGSTGPAIPGVQLRIENPDAATGEGEIQAKGPNVMKGYYNEPDLTREVFTDDGWFRTGDLGKFDKDGFLYIKGRLKTMIIGASGENIFPEEIESIINKMRYVLESIVVQKKGKLVGMIHLNLEEIEKQFKHFHSEARNYMNEKIEEILKDIHQKVNNEVNKFSRLHAVVLQPDPFEKTPTKKIKRFLYYS